MKITTNFSHPNFKSSMYIRGRAVDRTDAMCRSIATEAELDRVLKSSKRAGKDKFQPKAAKAEDNEEIDTDSLLGIAAYPYDDSALFLELRKISGVEQEPEQTEDKEFDIKQAFILTEETRQIDIKA